MGPTRSAPVRIDLVRVLELLRTHITAALCQTVFHTVRITERQRLWTLEALVQFWLAVILRAPRALSQALYETLEGREPLFPVVQASPEAFFERCQSLRPAFFAEIFTRFTARLLCAVCSPVKESSTMTTTDEAKVFTHVEEKSLRDHVAENIRRAIEAGVLKPRDRLVEAEIAAQMGISRAPVREAIRLLEQEGFVTTTPRKGTFIVELERQDIEEIYSLRSALEGLAVKMALPHLDATEMDALESLVNDMREAAEARDMPRLVEADLAFHQRIVVLSGHNRLMQDWLRMSTQLRLFFAVKDQLYENTRDIAETHQPLLDALRARDVDVAQRVLTEHIVEAGQLVLTRLDAGH